MIGSPAPGGASPARLVAAALVLAVLIGSALFAAGLSLGRELAGGRPEERVPLQAFLAAYEGITQRYVGRVEPRELIEAAIEGMFQSLDDPYSSYMPPERFDSDLSGVSGEFEGIGARMTAEDEAGGVCAPLGEECRLRVVDVLDGSPAERAGLRDEDEVTTIDGNPVAGLTMDDAILLIRGPRGTRVTIGVRRGEAVEEIPIERAVITSRDVRSVVLADGRVGYLRVDAFTAGAADDFREQLGALLASGVEGVVLDVRGDPGGFVEAAVAMASEFLASGPVLWEEDASGVQRPVEVHGEGLATDPGIGVAVLIDAGSASASEILAAALRDSGRATLVGERTFGKGTIQEWTQLPGEGGGFRLSVAQWLTPARVRVEGSGIAPDILVPLAGPGPIREADPDTDPQLRAAIEHLLGERSAVPAGSSPAAPASPGG